MINGLKKIKLNKCIVFLSLLMFKTFVLYAAEPDPPSFGELRGILSRVIGLFFAASAAVLIIMIAYGIIKGSLAAGDPRGLEGARGTWTYAIYGFLIIVLSMLIVAIIRGRLGLSGTFNFGLFFDNIFDAIDSLVNISQSNSSNNLTP